MEHIFFITALWLGLAVVSAVLAYHLRVSIALVEICVGVAVAAAAAALGRPDALGANMEWLRFLASAGAVLLTFLAGAELDPVVMRTKLGEVTLVGLVGFLAPFLGCAAIARFALGWDPRASLLCVVALSTTSMAVVYAVRLETGFNRTDFGKEILGACFINDLGTVIALGLSKIFGLYPIIARFRRERSERWYYTLMMSTGLTFGTISSLYGFSHGIITREQYSFLVAVVIASAVVPTFIAGAAFLPRHLLPDPAAGDRRPREEIEIGAEG